MKTSSFARGLFFLGGALLMKNVVGKPRSYWDGARGIVKACDDFDGEGDVVASGTVTFLRPLQCKTPLTFHIYSGTTVVIRSHDAINTTNVHFEVHPEANLTFSAKAVAIARDEGSKLPLVQTSGVVTFAITGWNDAYTDGSVEDKEGVVKLLKGGDLETTHPVRFSPQRLVVANEEAREEVPYAVKLSPLYRKLLEDFHAGRRSPQRDPADATSSTNGGKSNKATKDTTHGAGIIAARKKSREHAASPELTAEYRVYSRVVHLYNQLFANVTTDNSAAAATILAPTPPAPPSPASDKPSSSSSPDNHWVKKATPSLEVGDHWVKKATPSLGVGEELRGFLKSEDGKSVFWPGVDGSLRFGRFGTSTTANESGVGRSKLRATNLLAADIDKVREALRLRRELQMGGGGGGEEAEDGSVEERKNRREGKVGGRWWSWQKPSKRSQREIAAENAGEVCVSVSDEGCVDVTVDGTVVLSKSGPHRWDWVNRFHRPKDEGYKLHVTDTGIEVRLEDRTVWGVTADEWLG